MSPRPNPKITILDSSLPPHPPLPPWKRPSTSTPAPEIFTRISHFLPQLRAANAQLESEIAQGRISEQRIEDVGEDEERYIEMNLGLGVLEERCTVKGRKRRRKSVERAKGDGGKAELMEEVEVGSAGCFMERGCGGCDEEEQEEEEGEDSDSDGKEDEGSDSEEDEEDNGSSDNSDSSTPSTSDTDSSGQYPQHQHKQGDESARIDALLSVLGAESTESPQLLDRKRKWRHEERAVAQRDILAALLNIDVPVSGSGGRAWGVKRKPMIEVMEVEGKE